MCYLPNVGERVSAVAQGLVVLLEVANATLFALHFSCGNSGGGGVDSSDVGRRGCGSTTAATNTATAARVRATSGARYALGAQVLLALAVAGRGGDGRYLFGPRGDGRCAGRR